MNVIIPHAHHVLQLLFTPTPNLHDIGGVGLKFFQLLQQERMRNDLAET